MPTSGESERTSPGSASTLEPAGRGGVWEVEVSWLDAAGADPRAAELAARIGEWEGLPGARVRVNDLYFVEGEGLDQRAIELAAVRLLSDPVTQSVAIRELGQGPATPASEAVPGAGEGRSLQAATILKHPGVMDPVEASIARGLQDLGVSGVRARTGQRVVIEGSAALDRERRRVLSERVLSNPAIEEVYWNEDPLPRPFTAASPYRFEVRRVELRGLADDALERMSRECRLALSVEEMRAIEKHFAELGRDPTDAELETIAQTWSEHCCHKTLTSPVEHERDGETYRYENLLRETIGRATDELRDREEEPFCLSVFDDNAGVVAFDDDYGISFKVETHNHPSAIEPYGGAGTGIGGVLRDTLGTGLGAKPIVNTDVFCLGPPDLPRDEVPPGALHPRRVLEGVVSGVRDYGNRMGIPTASGALYFDERYVANPLVHCGSVGLIPRDAIAKTVRAGDRVVVLGGRTGRDGIHGATFSSVELTEESETVSGGAVQIGNAITEKMLLDVLLAARDRRLFRAVTDCGAGGLSSAVGEMGEETGARVELSRVPLKYQGLSYWEIWISEAQERMVLAVPPGKADELFALARAEDVEVTDIGEFTDTGRLELTYEGEVVADLGMRFLHGGRPIRVRRSRHVRQPAEAAPLAGAPPAGRLLRAILASPNVASKEWVIRQYDHEVQGRSVLKPLQGPGEGPGDGVAFRPRLDSLRGIVVGCGMNPRYGDLDPYRMALSALDESVRNVVAAGGDPDRAAVLDNFCWGNTDRPETLGALVEAARGCLDGARTLGTPFISGKDSLNNEYRSGDRVLSIPPSLLISSVAVVGDVRRLVSVDLKGAGNRLVLAGETRDELGGSHLLRALGRVGGVVPGLSPRAREIHRAVHRAIREGLALSSHDLSEGGLAAAAAEMALAGEVGIELRLASVPAPAPGEEGALPADPAEAALTLLFSESNTRYLIEVAPGETERLLELFGDLPAAVVGETIDYHILRVVGAGGETVLAEALDDLRQSWLSLSRSFSPGGEGAS